MQDEIPEPPEPSEQLKLELTAAFTAYVAPLDGVVIDAVGGEATVYANVTPGELEVGAVDESGEQLDTDAAQ